MKVDLKPCPFCGAPAEIVDIDEGENQGGSCVCCTSCLASGNVEFEFKENFVSNWNRRIEAAAPLPGAELVAFHQLFTAARKVLGQWNRLEDTEWTVDGVKWFPDWPVLGYADDLNALHAAYHEAAKVLGAEEDDIWATAKANPILAAAPKPTLCEDCPPIGYPTDKTRCEPCPRSAAPLPPAEPVMWQCRYKHLSSNDWTEWKPGRANPSIYRDAFEERPLYTAAPLPPAEPVAWRTGWRDGFWRYSDEKDHVGFIREDGGIVQPLYTAAPDTAQAVAAEWQGYIHGIERTINRAGHIPNNDAYTVNALREYGDSEIKDAEEKIAAIRARGAKP